MSVREVDTGVAYGMKPRAYNNLVEVGPGTPMGELMRRYWQPVFLSEDLTSDKPHKVRIFGENLVLFRDRSGKPGLVHEHCCHRGTSLYYGRIEEDGIRCCYHGWKFDVKGHCLEQPAEVDKGRNRDRVRQPWYPVQERYGLVYAYMGPPEKKPVLPRWSRLETLEPGQRVFAAVRPTLPCHDPYEPTPFNWLQAYENMMDGPHVPWLHFWHSGDQFAGSPVMRVDGEEPELPPYALIEDFEKRMVFERSEFGLTGGQALPVPGRGLMILRNECLVPNMVVITGADLVYYVPTCDTEFICFMLVRVKEGDRIGFDEVHGDKIWQELTEEEHRASPGDFEAQMSIGALPAHNQEHLSAGDRGIVMLRRRLDEAVRDVAEGRDPPGVIFDENTPPFDVGAHAMIPYQEAS